MAPEPISEIVKLMSDAEEWTKKARRKIAVGIRDQIENLEKLSPVVVAGGPTLQELRKAKGDILAGLKRMLKIQEGAHEFSIKGDLHQYLLIRNQAKMSNIVDSAIESLIAKIADGTVTVADLAEYILLGGEL